jgi:hypothetical protein
MPENIVTFFRTGAQRAVAQTSVCAAANDSTTKVDCYNVRGIRFHRSGAVPKWLNVALRFIVALFIFAIPLLIFALGIAVAGPSGGAGHTIGYFWPQLRSWVREPLLKSIPA